MTHINRLEGENIDTSHINPDGKFVGGSQKVDQSTLPWLHVYSQPFEHADAVIVGNRKALLILAGTVLSAIGMLQPRQEDFFATDGEGYSVLVKVLPDSPEKQVATTNEWDQYPPHYCDRFGRYDDNEQNPAEAIASAMRRLADKVEKLGEEHQKEVDDWKVAHAKAEMEGHKFILGMTQDIYEDLLSDCPHRTMADEPGKPDISLRKKYECSTCREEILGREMSQLRSQLRSSRNDNRN